MASSRASSRPLLLQGAGRGRLGPAFVAAVMALSMGGCTGQSSGPILTGDGPTPVASASAASDIVGETEPVPASVSPPGSATPLPAGPTDTPDDSRGDYRPRAIEVPILLYHHVLADTPLVRYTIAAQRFEQQLDYLISHGYQTITLQDLLDAIRAGAPLPQRPVVLTFDDGNQEVLELAYPRMQARGMVGVVYVVGNRIGVEGFLDAEALQTLRQAGWEIGSHGMTHRSLEDLSAEDLAKEVVSSKAVIEAALGEPIASFAYPFGIVTGESLLAVVRAGYTSGAGLGISNLHRPDGLFYLSRREVRGTYELQAFAELLGEP